MIIPFNFVIQLPAYKELLTPPLAKLAIRQLNAAIKTNQMIRFGIPGVLMTGGTVLYFHVPDLGNREVILLIAGAFSFIIYFQATKDLQGQQWLIEELTEIVKGANN